jgi:ketosteroid isomerase-like protein
MQNIEVTIEQFRQAVLEKDAETLNTILANELSYGHSDGSLDNKDSFIQNITNGTYQFITMELSNQVIIPVNDVIIVRHELDAFTNDEGKPGEAHLNVLLVFSKTIQQWKLIARQAVKKFQ